jgi:polyether ionophore transport system permease protein
LLTDLAPTASATAGQPARMMIARHTVRRSLRSAVLWGYVFGLVVASSAVSYSRIYKTGADRQRLAAAFGANHASSALFGPAPQLQTVAGFTVFKVSMLLILIGAIWGLLTSTRLLRGEEDAGRWELLLSGPDTNGRAVAQVLAGLGIGAGVMWAISAALIAGTGRSSSVHFGVTASLYFALAMVASAVEFLAVGAVASQLAPNRRQAAGYAAAFLGVSYGLRMVADVGAGLHGLIWMSPLGWVEQLQPLTDPRPLALVPIAVFTAVLAALAVLLAGRRDVGSGLWPDRNTRAPRVRLLSGATGLTVRLTFPAALGWAAGVAIAAVLIGTVAKAAGATIGGSEQQVLSRLGSTGSGAAAFSGLAFLILAIVIAFQAAGGVNAARAEEAEGRLDHVLAAPVSRSRWFVGRLLAGGAALVLSGITAGVFTWIGEATQGGGISFPTALESGINAVPPALFALGIGALAHGFWPRRAGVVVYVVLGWSVLIEFAGGFAAQSHWLLDTSLFHQMASAPAVPPDWQVNGILTGLGLAAMLLGQSAFRHRDLQGE